jgi:hypothetical protein
MQQAAWSVEYPGCAWAVACAESGLIGVEVDVKARAITKDHSSEEVGLDRAWRAWVELCASWGFPTPLTPHVKSRSGGFHVYFRPEPSIEVKKPRQRGLVKLPGWQQHCIETRVNGFLLIPPSVIGGASYVRWPDTPVPYDAPAALIDSLRDATLWSVGEKPAGVVKPGSFDLREFARYLLKLHHCVGLPRGVWLATIYAMVAQYGRPVAHRLAYAIHDGEPNTSDQIDDLVARAHEEFHPGDATFDTLFKHGHEHGIHDIVRPYALVMFGGPAPELDIEAVLAEIDTEASTPVMTSGLPTLSGRGEMQARLWSPVLSGVPQGERMPTHPEMPDTGHPLRAAINAAIPGIVATGDVDALAVIEAVHPQTAAAVGAITPMVRARAEALRQDAEHAMGPNDYTRDHKGIIERDNVDNMRFFLNSLAVEIRFNAWIERVEGRGWHLPNWTTLDDAIVARLRMRAGQTGTRFLPTKEFAWDALSTIAHSNIVDPAINLLNRFEREWDGTARLSTWLTNACGTPDDAYHRAVGATILLGLVARIRCPGVKFDLMPVFISETQGTSKSTLASVLALREEWFTDTVRLGDEAKELVLSLAGICVAEVSEMRTRGEAEAVKAMISRRVDRGRTAFARAVSDRPRRNLFIGSTNHPEFLEDPTGARRFLPIHVSGEVKIDWVRKNLPQLVGEAAAMQSRDVEIGLPRAIWADAAEHQKAATQQSAVDALLRDWFDGDREAWITTANLVLLLRLALGRVVSSKEYAPVMRALKFLPRARRIGKEAPGAWIRGQPAKEVPGYGPHIGHNGRPMLQAALPSHDVPAGDLPSHAAPSLVPGVTPMPVPV